MHFHYSASALALIASSVLAQECPAGYEKSKLKWTTCPVNGIQSLQCSTLEVPMDYSNPTGSALKLRLVRVPASEPNSKTKSIIFNPGGPGSSGIESIIDNAGGLTTQELAGKNFHIVSFDPRGTGLSIPFTCPDLPRSRDLKNTDTDIQSIYDALTLQSDKCAETKYKMENALMGTAYVARDIKAIAEALGEDNLIRYLGYSYGTLLGATTAAMFPRSIDRMVLDGNINPTDYYRGLGEEAIADVDRAVARFFVLCAEAGPSKCTLATDGVTGRTLQQNFDTFLTTLTYEQSYVIRDTFTTVLYNPAKFNSFAVDLWNYYKDKSTIPKRSVRRQDDGEGQAPQPAPSDAFQPTDSAKVEAPQALNGITCGDVIQRPSPSVANFKRWKAIYQRTSKYAGDGGLLTTLYQCSLWKNEAKEKFTSSFSNIATLNPILFINTQYDPVTPLISAQNSAMGFRGARVLVSSGMGHCSTAESSGDLDSAIKTYFADASFPLVNKIYTPDQANAFVELLAENPNADAKRRAIKRGGDYSYLWKNEATLIRRQSAVPVGCVKIPISSSSVAVASPSLSIAPPSGVSTVVSSGSSSAVLSMSSIPSSAISSIPVATDSSIPPSSSASNTLGPSSASSTPVSSDSSVPASSPASSSQIPSSSSFVQPSVSSEISSASMKTLSTFSTISSASQSITASSTQPLSSSSLVQSSVSSEISSASMKTLSTFSTISSAPQITSTVSIKERYGGGSSSSSSSSAISGHYAGSSSSSSSAYRDYPGSSSTHAPVYGGHAGSSSSSASFSAPTPIHNNRYGTPVSSPTPKTTVHSSVPYGYVPITKTIITKSCETVTQCGGYGCQLSTITKTLTETTVVTVPITASMVIVTIKSAISSAPGQGYYSPPQSAPGQGYNTPQSTPGQGHNVPQSALGQGYNVPQSSVKASSAVGTPIQQSSKPSSSSVPAVSQPGYGGTPGKAPSSTPVYTPSQPSGPAVNPSSASHATYVVGTGGVYSKPTGVPANETKPNGTPIGGYPVQFTGAAATERVLLSFVALVVGITSMAFML